MAILGSATYKLDTDNSGLTRGMAKAEQSSRESARRIAGNFAKVGAGMLAAGGAIGFGLLKLVGQASVLNESINAVNVVFTTGSKIIHDYSRDSAKAVGLAKSDFLQLSAQTGGLFTNYGLSADEAANKTIILAERAADLASVYNTDVKRAFDAISAGIRGETEAIRFFGGTDVTDASLEMFLLEKGIGRTVSELSQAEKGLFRFEAMLAQTENTSGDFRNTAGSAANAMKIVNAQIKNAAAVMGQGLLPVVEAVLPWVQSVVASFQAWAEANPKLLQVLVIAAAAVAGLAVAIGGLLLVVAGGIMVFTALGVATLITVGWIALIVLGVAALVAGGILLVKHWDKVKSSLVSVFKTVKDWLQPVVDLFDDWAENNPKLMRALVVARQAVGVLTASLGWLLDKAKAAWQSIKTFAEEQWAKLKGIWDEHVAPIWENLKEEWVKHMGPAFLWLEEKFEGLPGGVQLAFLGAAAHLAASMLALLTVWVTKMLFQFAVFMATSLRSMAVWTAKMLIQFAVFTATSLLRMALWPAQMLLHLAVWTATSLLRMALWVTAMLAQFAVWTATSLLRMAGFLAARLVQDAVFTITTLARWAGFLAARLVQDAVFTITSLAAWVTHYARLVGARVVFLAVALAAWVTHYARLVGARVVFLAVALAAWVTHYARLVGAQVVFLAGALARMTVWAAAMAIQWAVAFGPVTLILLAVAGLGAAAFLMMANWDSVDARWRALWDGMKVAAVGVLNDIIAKINEVISLWNAIPVVPDIGGIGEVNPDSIGTPSLEDAINYAFAAGPLKVGSLLKWGSGKLFGGGAKDYSGLHPEEFAKGGIVTGPTLAMLGEAGPEAVVPLDNLGKGGRGLTVQVFMDGATILEADDAEQYVVDMVDRAVRRGVVLGSV